MKGDLRIIGAGLNGEIAFAVRGHQFIADKVR